MSDYVWKALLAEFVGTFTLVFIGASAVALTVGQGGSLLTSAFAFGLALMTIIYVWGSYSGAHVNPAVSFGFAVAGQMNWGLMLGYWVAQLLGGIAAAALVAYFFGTSTGAGASVGILTNSDVWKAILMEAFLTFFLVIAYLFIYRNPMLALVSGIAVGLVLTFTFLAGGYLTGASTNPARSLGPALFSNNMGSYWIYIVGPLLGALVAALVYKLFTVDFSCCYKLDECGNKILDDCGRPLKECRRPVLDSCGNEVKDCYGCPEYEYVVKHERKYHHMQETPMTALGGWMTSHGVDPRYAKQEFDHVVERVSPTVLYERDTVISTQSPSLISQPSSILSQPAPLSQNASLSQTAPLSQLSPLPQPSPVVLSQQPSTLMSQSAPLYSSQPVFSQTNQSTLPTVQSAVNRALTPTMPSYSSIQPVGTTIPVLSSPLA